MKNLSYLKNIHSVEDLFRLAKNGNAQAQYDISTFYEWGDESFPQDYTQAVKWLRRFANNGYADAMFALCFYYFKGDVITRDEDKGIYWLKRAAQYGNAEAQAVMVGQNPYEKKCRRSRKLHVVVSVRKPEIAKHSIPWAAITLTGSVSRKTQKKL